MKIGLCTIAFSELPLEEVLDIAAESRFDGVEIWGKAPHIPNEYDPEYVKAISRSLASELPTYYRRGQLKGTARTGHFLG